MAWKKSALVILALAAVLGLAQGLPLATRAQDAKPAANDLRVGVVDLQLIMRDSVAAQGVRGEVETKQTGYRKEISGKEDELRGQREELQRQRTVLSPEAFAQREAEFAKKIEALQRDVAERNHKLDEILAGGMKQVQAATLKIVADIADARDVNLVLDKSQLLLVAKELDFSGEVLKRLNKELPKVTPQPPKEPK